MALGPTGRGSSLNRASQGEREKGKASGSTDGGVGINSTPKGMWSLRIIPEKGPYLFALLSLLTRPWDGDGAEAGLIALVLVSPSEAAGLVDVVFRGPG